LTGATLDDNKVLISTSEDGGAPVAIGFRAKKANGKYRYFWLYRVKFGIPATNLQTKGDSITFSTPTIEGTVIDVTNQMARESTLGRRRSAKTIPVYRLKLLPAGIRKFMSRYLLWEEAANNAG